MGIGAIIMLAVLGTLACARANRWIGEGETLTAVTVCVLFTIEVAVLVAGNPWVWLAWALIGAAKMIWLPSAAVLERADTMPLAVHHLNIVFSVLVSGIVFALFQWLR
jgi:hypothetical protein